MLEPGYSEGRHDSIEVTRIDFQRVVELHYPDVIPDLARRRIS